jgi:hypothetical protein
MSSMRIKRRNSRPAFSYPEIAGRGRLGVIEATETVLLQSIDRFADGRTAQKLV